MDLGLLLIGSVGKSATALKAGSRGGGGGSGLAGLAFSFDLETLIHCGGVDGADDDDSAGKASAFSGTFLGCELAELLFFNVCIS